MDGPLPLAWTDMAQWAVLTATVVRPAEWRILRSIDHAYLAANHELDARQRSAADNPHTVSEREMSPELFDAIFQ